MSLRAVFNLLSKNQNHIINSQWEHKLYKSTTNSAGDRGRPSRDLFLFCIWLVGEDGVRFLHHSQAEI